MTADDIRLDGLAILVLEDEYILGDDARRVLARAGADVIGPFGSAVEALAAADRKRPDCALLDVDLGAGPDFEPARALKTRGVPLVFFTGYDMSVVPLDLRRERFLEKPIFMAAIVDIVAAACGRTGGGCAVACVANFDRAERQAGI